MTVLRRLGIAIGVATVMAAVAGPALSKTISSDVVPFKSISGVQFGWTPAHVEKFLGKPQLVTGNKKKPGVLSFNVGDNGDGNLSFAFATKLKGDPVEEMSADWDFHTVGGINSAFGAGSPIASVKKVFGKYPHFSCNGKLWCTTTKGATIENEVFGAVEMQFDFAGGKVDGFDLTKNLYHS